MDKIRDSGRYKRITPQEVLAAYDSGEERLGVWTMKCIGYDTKFQLELYEKFPTWVPAPRKPRKKKGDTEGKSKGKKSVKQEKRKAVPGSTVVSKKRKRNKLSNSESDLTELESEDEPERGVEEGKSEREEVKTEYLDAEPVKAEDTKPAKKVEDSPESPTFKEPVKLHPEQLEEETSPTRTKIIKALASEERAALVELPKNEPGTESHSASPSPGLREDVEMIDLTSDSDEKLCPMAAISPDTVLVRQETPDVSIIPTDPSPSAPDNPQSRRRLIAEIIVPTWAQLQADRKKFHKKLQDLKNPKIHKIQDLELDLDTVASRIKEIGFDPYPVDLPVDIKEFAVSRDFLSSTYGGNMQKAFPTVSKKFFRRHGMNNFAFVHPHYQPVGPEMPGAPGLFLCSDVDEDFPGNYRVFTRIGSNIWQLLGIYEIKLSIRPFLTVAEWARQDLKVRNTWYRQICTQGWGISVCARVIGRKELGREPTKKEVKKIEESKRYKNVTPEDIAKAYMRGEEKMGVWTMKCVGYDKKLQQELCEKFPHYVPMPRKSRKGGKAGVRSSGETGRGSRGRKRKRSESPDFAQDSELESEDEKSSGGKFILVSDEEQEEEELVYRSRGTKSRPIHL
ncbi:unnamed protein product [Cyclocybe aegerita]|uniref:DUF6697 domain-containing protein n=1 Tax=Cyclocybe aegerita TaxID=1973307 RepID=A0A8S0WRS8_CYCAE|nr:unnamed protein product [Cyclocybe aegerita]